MFAFFGFTALQVDTMSCFISFMSKITIYGRISLVPSTWNYATNKVTKAGLIMIVAIVIQIEIIEGNGYFLQNEWSAIFFCDVPVND